MPKIKINLEGLIGFEKLSSYLYNKPRLWRVLKYNF
jgi:hypothetical protein